MVLDTNVLFDDWHFRGVPLQVLVETAPRLGITLAIPQVVRDELSAKFAAAVEEAGDTINTALGQLRRLTGSLPTKPVVLLADRERAAYVGRLASFAHQHQISFLQYPQVTHADTVQRIHAKKAPFSSGERGYRDYLIWCTVLEHCGPATKAVLITRNTKDFGSGGKLAEEYAADARRANAAIRIANSILDFLRSDVFPVLEPKESLRARLVTHDLPHFDPLAWAYSYFDEGLEAFEGTRWHLPYGYTRARVIEVEAINDHRIGDVYEFRTEGSLVEVEFDLDLQVEMEASFDPDPDGWPKSWDWSTTSTRGKSVTCSAELVVHPNTGEILSGSVTTPEEIWVGR